MRLWTCVLSQSPPHISVSDDGPRVGIGKLHPVSQIYVSGDKNLVQPHSLTLSFTYGCFQAATAELNSPNRDSITHPPTKKKKYYLAPYKTSFPAPGPEESHVFLPPTFMLFCPVLTLLWCCSPAPVTRTWRSVSECILPGIKSWLWHSLTVWAWAHSINYPSFTFLLWEMRLDRTTSWCSPGTLMGCSMETA